MKNQFFLLIALSTVMCLGIASCNKNDNQILDSAETGVAPKMETRAVGTKTPKFTVYIETNDVNPLNAKEYYFCNSNPQEEVIDHVILFASNINGTANSATLYHNPNQTYILNHASTLIQPLQQKGIKVLLGVLGNWTGVGFANLTSAMRESFAQQIASCVNTYGLDGVDFDDEYANYSVAPSNLPSPSGANYGALVERVKQLLPGKLVTAFRYGYAPSFPQSTLNVIDYMWPNFGANNAAPAGFSANKWAKMSIHVISQYSTNPSDTDIMNGAANYGQYGAIMLFNLREWDASTIMNWFAYDLWGNDVCWTGVSHPKNY